MKNIFKIMTIGLLLTACGNVTRNQDEPVSPSMPCAASYAGDEVVSDPQPEAGAPSVTTGGSTSVEVAGTGGANEIAAGGEAGAPSGESSPCEPRISVKILSHNDDIVAPGSKDVSTIRFSLTAFCRDIEIKEIGFIISAADFTAGDQSPFVHGDANVAAAWNFRNFKLIDESTGATVSGPLDHPDYGIGIQQAELNFRDSFLLKQGVPRPLSITLDVSDPFVSKAESTRYSVTYSYVVPASHADSETLYAPDFPQPWPAFTVKTLQWGEFSFCRSYAPSPTISEGCCTTGQFAHDYDKPLSGMLIKGVDYEGIGEKVYYFASNGKRYSFPTRTELVSWYDWHPEDPSIKNADVCRSVREFSDETIADIPYGGNVTIRPGTYLVRDTDPRVFAVARHQTLRQIGVQLLYQSGATVYGDIVHQLFPKAEQDVCNVGDGFFTNYVMGTELTDALQYDSAVEYDWGAPNTLERELGVIE